MRQLIAVFCAVAATLVIPAGCYSKSTHDSAHATKIGGAAVDLQSPPQPKPAGTRKPIPGVLHCGHHLKPVWVYVPFKTFYVPADPLYGRTDKGMYMCPGEAGREGYTLAGPPPSARP